MKVMQNNLKSRLIKIWFGFMLAFMACSTIAPKNPITLFSNPTPTFPPSTNDETPPDQPFINNHEGETRFNPYPPNRAADAFTVRVKVEEFIVGEVAWQMLQDENQFNDPPPQGKQYVLVKLYVENTLNGGKRDINRYDFRLTGTANIRYRATSQVVPSPELQANLEYEDSTTGWVPYLVDENETGLTLFVDIVSFGLSDGEVFHYFALDENDILIDLDEDIPHEPSLVGDSVNNPAVINENISSEQWNIKISDMIRGDDAYEKILEANQFNDLPPVGMEYILIWVEAEYFGAEDEFGLINSSWFRSMNPLGEMYQTISVVEPSPELNAELFSNGKYQGWVALLVEKNQPFIIMVDPVFDYETINNRYIELDD
jgi:hypothetical protein